MQVSVLKWDSVSVVHDKPDHLAVHALCYPLEGSVRGSCGKLATWVVARRTTIFRTVPIGADYHILVIGM